MATAYPAALDTATQQPSPSSSTDLDTSGYEHDIVHTNHSGALIALETKVGLTDSNAASGAILVGTGASTTAWTTTPSINITGNASGTAATVTGAAQAAITSTGTLTGVTVSGTGTIGVAVGQAVDLDRKTDNYTLVLTDAGKVIEMNKASAVNLTVPPNSSVAFPAGTQIVIVQLGAGQVTIVEGSGVTTRSDDDKAKIKSRYSSCVLIKHETDEWYILGNLDS